MTDLNVHGYWYINRPLDMCKDLIEAVCLTEYHCCRYIRKTHVDVDRSMDVLADMEILICATALIRALRWGIV